jgi:ABC-2 type transport system permease protein
VHQVVPLPGVAAAGLLGFGLSVAIAGPVLALSAAGRRKAQVVGLGIALAAVSYALNFFAIAWSKAAFLRYASPFHYYSPADALVRGSVPWGSLAVLVAAGAAGMLLAARLIVRRDLAP